MKFEIVHEKLLRIVERREHVSDLLGHVGELLPGRVLGSESGGAHFQYRSGFKHVLETETVKLRQQTQWLTVECRRSVDDKGAGSLSRLQHTHRGQRTQSGTQ